MRLNAEKATGITDQTVSFLNTSNGFDPLTLKVATSSGPRTLELVDVWDSASKDVLEQVIETLFYYDLTDVDLSRINLLAESYHWVDTTHLQIKLREGILFHDGTPFNAVAAKWNLDRLLYLTNCTGTNTGTVVQTQSLWMFPDGVTPIIASVATVGTYNITITLNGAYAPLLSTLSYINAGMISPTFHAGDATSFIDLATGDVCGTGPFTYESFTPDVEVKFTRWDDYWKGPAYFEELLFVIFNDYTTAHNALLSHAIDINRMASDQNLALYDADPTIIVKRFTDDTGRPSLVYQYMGINNEKYNETWRKAISFAVNYSYVIDELRLGNAFRSYTAISPGYGAAFNTSLATDPNTVPDNGDISVARATMQSMGFGASLVTDADWIAKAESTTPFATVRYTYNLGNTFREDLGVAVTEWLKLIGIAVQDDGVEWATFLDYLYDIGDGWDHLELYGIGWAPDYLEPYNMLDPLFNPMSRSNSAQVNDVKLTTMMAASLAETDEAARNIIYQNIQGYMATKGFFHIPLYHPKLTYVHLKEIKGVPYNAMQSFYAYPIYRATPDPFSLSSDAGNPDDDGTFTLTWSLAEGTDNYSVYQHSSYITEINESLIILAEDVSDLSLLLSDYPEGTYYFIVAAINEYGDTLSNCINVVVLITDDHEIEVNLEIPIGIEIDTSYIINATVRNIGLNDEVDVELYLYLDDVIVDFFTIPYLPVGEIGTIQYDWTPTEYKTYTFKAYAPPVPGELSQDDNLIIVDVQLIDTQLFDGLFIEHIFDQMGYIFNTNFSYMSYQDGLFYETWGVEGMSAYQWYVDPSSRLMSGGSIFGDGFHTPVWIFTDVSLGDIIPIAVVGEGDHIFNVTREFIYDLPNFGPVGIWELEDLTIPGGTVLYEKSTGLLLNGIFFAYGGMYNYTFEFVDTNAQFEYLTGPEPFTLSSDAEDPDDDGTFTLSWTESIGVENYSVYEHSSFITEITEDLILLANDIVDLSFPLEGYSDGTYYFIVVAHNENGDTLSNCIQVDVDIKIPLTILYDTIPDEVTMSYTRTPQIIGSFSAYSSSKIISVGWLGEPDPGFALFTTFNDDENAGIYLSETTIMTTNQLEPGIHLLNLRIWDEDGDFYDKIFTVIVYRQAQLNLRGEFDYLLKENVKISIVAQVFDVEDQFLLNPIAIEGMIVHIRIVDYDGNVKVEDTMTYDSNGFFHWDSVQTIAQLKNTFSKGIYIVQAWIEFPPESYYLGGKDVIEFHIDPPAEDEVDIWFFIEMLGFSGLIGVVLTLAILLKRKRSIE